MLTISLAAICTNRGRESAVFTRSADAQKKGGILHRVIISKANSSSKCLLHSENSFAVMDDRLNVHSELIVLHQHKLNISIMTLSISPSLQLPFIPSIHSSIHPSIHSCIHACIHCIHASILTLSPYCFLLMRSH